MEFESHPLGPVARVWLFRVQPPAAGDQPADGAGDEGVAADREAEEFASHDGARQRDGARSGEDADEAEGGADAEREAEQGGRGAAEGRTDEEERGDLAATIAGADAKERQEELEDEGQRTGRFDQGGFDHRQPPSTLRPVLPTPTKTTNNPTKPPML